ncbi:MAG: HNH endonuclease, partial [Acidipropionibacterium acidipropionici]|nr:HNH endonuclease [Acidipropionibacterium acidipropionici]
RRLRADLPPGGNDRENSAQNRDEESPAPEPMTARDHEQDHQENSAHRPETGTGCQETLIA